MDSTDVMSFIELLKQPKQQPKQQPQPPPLATQQQTTSKSAVPKVTTQSTGYQSLPLPSVPSAPLTKSQVPVTQADISTDDLAHLNKVAGQIANFTDEYVKCYGSDVVIATLVGSLRRTFKGREIVMMDSEPVVAAPPPAKISAAAITERNSRTATAQPEAKSQREVIDLEMPDAMVLE